MVTRVDAANLAKRVLGGDRRAVARAISMVEDGSSDLAALSEALYPKTGRAYTVGLTGSPGVGKSSLASALVEAARAREVTVAVLAIDPTSPFSGGALLGDRVRMQAHATDPGVFIRSMATRGHLGGMALAAPEAIRVLDASGRDFVIVETVGVGQAEVEIATAADTTLVVVAPGWGDSVQVAKAGILEIADVFVVNKADREGATEAVRELNLMLRTGPKLAWTGTLQRKRRQRVLEEVESMVAARLRQEVGGMLDRGSETGLAGDLAERRIDPYAAATLLLEQVRADGSSGRGR
jgi:LAO/AO transport system kinase